MPKPFSVRPLQKEMQMRSATLICCLAKSKWSVYLLIQIIVQMRIWHFISREIRYRGWRLLRVFLSYSYYSTPQKQICQRYTRYLLHIIIYIKRINNFLVANYFASISSCYNSSCHFIAKANIRNFYTPSFRDPDSWQQISV